MASTTYLAAQERGKGSQLSECLAQGELLVLEQRYTENRSIDLMTLAILTDAPHEYCKSTVHVDHASWQDAPPRSL